MGNVSIDIDIRREEGGGGYCLYISMHAVSSNLQFIGNLENHTII